MKFQPADLEILEAWADGKLGATQRLSRRAWRVLQERAPTKAALAGGGAWANAKEADVWVKNYRNMGLVGLIDATRGGRPSVHAGASKTAGSGFTSEVWSNHKNSKDPKSDKVATLKSLNRAEREALWRAHRKTGQSYLRNRNGPALGLRVPIELRDLLAIVLTPEIKIIACLKGSDKYWSELNGEWIGGPASKRVIEGVAKASERRNRLFSALEMDFAPARKKPTNNGHSDWLVSKAASHIAEVAGTYPNEVSVHIIFDGKKPTAFIQFLKVLRAKRLWASTEHDIRGASLIKSLQCFSFEESADLPLKRALEAYLGNSLPLGWQGLHARLSKPRKGPFGWIRTTDESEGSEGLSTDLGISDEVDPLDGTGEQDLAE